MTACRASRFFALFFITLMPAQAKAADEAFEAFVETAENLSQSIKALDGKIARSADREREIWAEVTKQFVGIPDARRYFERFAIDARQSGSQNEKEVFLEALVHFICQNVNDGCQFRQEIIRLRNNDYNQNRRLGSIEDRVGSLEERLGVAPSPVPWSGNYRGPQTPTPATPPALPVPDDLTLPNVRVWTGPLDGVVDRRAYVSPTAIRVAKCVDYWFPDHTVYHGDMWREPSGRHVLVRH